MKLRDIFNHKYLPNALSTFFRKIWGKITRTPVHTDTLSAASTLEVAKPITKNQASYTYGTDIYGCYGPNRVTPAIALNTQERTQFNKSNALSNRLLNRDRKQPLLEEGWWHPEDEDIRAHKGENYLTYEAIALLVHKRVVERAVRDKRYDASNVLVMDQDPKKIDSLQHLKLHPGEDAKLIYVGGNLGIHATPLYIRNIGGRIHALIVEPFGKNDSSTLDELRPILQQSFDNPKIIRSSTPIQADFYSCSTFALKCMMYFAKHGDKVFPYIDKPEHLIRQDEDGCYVLAPDKLPPALMKLARKQIALPEGEKTPYKDTIVSDKHQLTLEQYHNKADLEIDGKHYNSAPLITKYKYIEELNRLLKDAGINKDDIILDNEVKLPARLQLIIDKLGSVKTPSAYTNTGQGPYTVLRS